MPQNDRNSRNRKHRRAYDQARDDQLVKGGGGTGAAGRAPSAAAARVQAATWGTAGTQDIPPAATPSRTPIMTPMRPAPAGIRSAR